jgi:outer membrane translocation and assembly module TamA
VGAAVFFDAGRAWFEDDPFADANELLRDVGAGLRLGSSRSSSGAMIHLDVAYPLDGDDSIDKLQWLVSTSDTF